MQAAWRLGLSMSEWERLTPRELMLLIQAHTEDGRSKAKGKKVEMYNLAGAIRAMVLSKHAPSFERMFPQTGERKKMSDEQMFRQVQALNRHFGGTEE